MGPYPGGLSDAQLRHFSEHGWVIQRGAFTPAECAAFREALDRLAARQYCPGPHEFDGGPTLNIDNQINSGESIFLDWMTHPKVLPALKQVIGAPPTFECCHAMINRPHPKRHDAAEVAKLLDPKNYSWHRGMRPKWGIVDSDKGHGFKYTTFMNNITYLTDIDTELDGGTALLSGSHLTDSGNNEADIRLHLGGGGARESSCQRITKIEAGSIVHFTESLLHSNVPVLSERTRYAMFYGFTPPWGRVWRTAAGTSAPSRQVLDAATGELSEILQPSHHYGGQYAMVQSKL